MRVEQEQSDLSSVEVECLRNSGKWRRLIGRCTTLCQRHDMASLAPSVSDRDGFGPGQFVALFSCPGVHTFTHFRRKTDCRFGVMPSGATAFLCTRGHMLPFLFTFIISRPSGDLQSPRRKAAVIPALPGAYALWAVRTRCAG